MRAQNATKQLLLRCEKPPEIRCTHGLHLSQNLPLIEIELHLEAVVEIATNLSS